MKSFVIIESGGQYDDHYRYVYAVLHEEVEAINIAKEENKKSVTEHWSGVDLDDCPQFHIEVWEGKNNLGHIDSEKLEFII